MAELILGIIIGVIATLAVVYAVGWIREAREYRADDERRAAVRREFGIDDA